MISQEKALTHWVQNQSEIMMTKALLGFQYQIEDTHKGTSLAGLPLFQGMANVSGLKEWIAQNLSTKSQGWSDLQIVTSLILLNLSGGDCVDDIERFEADPGMRTVLLNLETQGMGRKGRRQHARRFRKNKTRAFPSPSTLRRYLDKFHNPEEELKRVPKKAFIPAPNELLQSLSASNDTLINYLQAQQPCDVATLDQDATLASTAKRNAFYCYEKYKAYQPFNTYWNEQSLLLHSEFRDGNVPPGYEQLRSLEESLTKLPSTVKKVFLRSDSAGYQEVILRILAKITR